MTRQEFTVATKKAAKKRAGDICECGCGRPFGDHPLERPEYHHVIEAKSGGDNSLGNCLVVRVDCHKAITATVSAPKAAKIRREENRRNNTTRRKAKMPYRKFDGTPVWPGEGKK